MMNVNICGIPHKQINLAIGAITHAELVMDFPDVILDALNSVIAFLATMDEQSERKNGKWIHDNPNSFKCSKCNKYLDIGCGNMKMNFCPNCGADMREGEQE